MAPPSKQLESNPDVVARAEKERADRLEAELAAVKAQLEVAKAGPKAPVVPAKGVVTGTRTYRLTQAHYRAGKYYQPGELVTVTDERPGKTWEPVEPRRAAAPVVVEDAATVRPSDLSI